MKTVTQNIMSLINKRMEIAKKIGEIKNDLQIKVIDDKVEHEIKDYILHNSLNKELDPEFLGRIINILIKESVSIQNNEIFRIRLLPENNIKNNIMQKGAINNANPEDITSNIKIKTHMDVFNKAKQLDQLGKKIIHMEVGEPDFLPPPQVKAELMSIYGNQRYHYTEPAGILDLRKKLSSHLFQLSENKSNEINPRDVIITVGGRFAIFCTFCSILNPGDEVIIIEPAWPAYKDCANYLGVKTKILRTNLEQNWDPDISVIENSVNVNTKIICLNYPNNPTGKIIDEKKLQSIVQIAEKNNIYILSDEVYYNFAFKRFSSILKIPYENSIMVGSFSKTYSMTGFRVGYAHSKNKNLIEKLAKIQSLTLTSVPEPMQFCALAALSYNPSEYASAMNKRISFVCDKLKKMPFEFLYPDGAMYVYAKINDELTIDDLALTEKLLQKGVAVAPGSGFGDTYKNYIRLSACIEQERLDEGLNIINQLVLSL